MNKTEEREVINEIQVVDQQEGSFSINDNEQTLQKNIVEKKIKKKDKKKNDSTENDSGGLFDEVYVLAKLLNTTVENLREEFFSNQIERLMSRLKKVIVRDDSETGAIKKIIFDAHALKLGGLVVSPVSLSTFAKLIKKNDLNQMNVTSIIDFPFGESAFKGKIANLKESIKLGVDAVEVTMPNILTTPNYKKKLKKQVKKIARKKIETGVVFNATDLTEDNIRRALKVVRKTKISHVTFAFGETNLEQFKQKMEIINKHRGNKKIFVLASIERAESLIELFKLKIDMVLTPFADDIGRDLIKRFNVKSIKLK